MHPLEADLLQAVAAVAAEVAAKVLASTVVVAQEVAAKVATMAAVEKVAALLEEGQMATLVGTRVAQVNLGLEWA